MKILKKLWRAYSARLQNVPDVKSYRKDCKLALGITLFAGAWFAVMGGWWLLATAVQGLLAVDCICGLIATKEINADEIRKKD